MSELPYLKQGRRTQAMSMDEAAIPNLFQNKIPMRYPGRHMHLPAIFMATLNRSL
jgi:hypothetical protein